MFRRISSALTVATLLLCLSPTPAAADGWWSWLSRWRDRREERRDERREEGREERNKERREARQSIPEFDPAALGAISALVIGGGVLLARRRKR